MSRLALCTIALVGTVFSACQTAQPRSVEPKAQAIASESSPSERLWAECLSLWQERQFRGKLDKTIERLQELVKLAPDHLEALTLLSRAHSLLAESYAQSLAEKRRLWQAGAEWGQKAMAIHPDYTDESDLSVLDKRYVGAIYWTAVNLGKWAQNSGIRAQRGHRKKIRKLIERVQKLDPRFFYGAAPRYLGVYYAVAPGFAGGNLKRSLQSFHESLRIAPDYLMTRVLIAEHYAARKSDRKLFRAELDKVLLADPRSLPEAEPENLLAQKKAKWMLERMEGYFVD